MPQLERLRGPGFCNEELDSWLLASIVTGEPGMNRLRSLEWGPYITNTMLEKLTSLSASSGNWITKLKLRGGDERLTPVVRKLLATMPRLQQLDLSETEVSAEALCGITKTAKLTHLSLKPGETSTAALAHFIASHPSIMRSLQVLSLESRAFSQSQQQTQNPDTLSNLLSYLPSTLKSLNISSLTIQPSNLSQISKLCTHLTELAVGPGLQFRELEQLLVPGLKPHDSHEGLEDESGIASKYIAVLSPIADALAICQLRRRLNSIPAHTTTNATELRYLDIRRMDADEQRRLKTSVLLGNVCTGLRIIEISESVYLSEERMGRVVGSVGWGVRCRGGRCWVERI